MDAAEDLISEDMIRTKNVLCTNPVKLLVKFAEMNFFGINDDRVILRY